MTILICFLILIAAAGGCDNGDLTILQYILITVPTLALLSRRVLKLNKGGKR